MNMQDKKFLEEIYETRNLSHATKYVYQRVVEQYTKQNHKKMEQLIQDAEKEEEQGIRWKSRKLKKQLLKYRTFLYNNYLKSTAKRYFTTICTIYRHHGIEIGDLPPVSQINTNINRPINYQDIPDAEIIRKVLDIANIRERALILFILSSGCGRTETSNITIQDYINATKEYHHSNNIYEALNILSKLDNVVPTFELLRQKTNKFYTTFCTPEAVTAINLYLNSIEYKLFPEDKLFDVSTSYMNAIFVKLNDKLSLGWKGTYRRFRPHMLRKFHASRLHNDGMSMDNVDSLQGRSKDAVHSAYFMDDPKSLKEEYIHHMDCLMIEWNCNDLTYKSEEYIRLEMDNIRKTKELDSLSNRLESIESYIFKGLSKRDVDDMEGWLD